jgi:hypothetical protein
MVDVKKNTCVAPFDTIVGIPGIKSKSELLFSYDVSRYKDRRIIVVYNSDVRACY